jgi:hypothetical protein
MQVGPRYPGIRVTSMANVPRFYEAVLDALEYRGTSGPGAAAPHRM